MTIYIAIMILNIITVLGVAGLLFIQIRNLWK
mgnify:CR=1 FL=1